MYTIFSVLIFIACVLLILIVLVQNSKGGGLAANFSSSNQIMGVRKTTDFLEKATWTLAGVLLFFCIGASMSLNRDGENADDLVDKEYMETMVDPNQLPIFPTPGEGANSGETTPGQTTPDADGATE